MLGDVHARQRKFEVDAWPVNILYLSLIIVNLIISRLSMSFTVSFVSVIGIKQFLKVTPSPLLNF